ncbi:transglutaminase family protein [Coraliomargarita parva]|uniref:transglutaminase family protein n=1 Tax=Coraliomargarita parva TaxID=3014050 RepID=UPI0022B3497B|nr:transglutaminase family protein [Coraliomargarita parva]
MNRIRIYHLTEYRFSAPVSFSEHRLLLRPREGHDIRIESSRLSVSPSHHVKWYRDIYGNSVGLLRLTESSDCLRIESEVFINHYESQPLNFIVDERAVTYPFPFEPEERLDLLPYRSHTWPNETKRLKEWVARFWRPGQSIETYVLLDQMNKGIVNDFAYRMREEPGVQSPAQTLMLGSGSCRDFAAFFIEACRYLGFAIRFVSGYLHNPGSTQHGSTHAWSEVYLPGAGWIGFDSTSGQVTGDHHIATAVHRHPESIPPVAGRFTGPGAVQSQLTVTVDVSAV